MEVKLLVRVWWTVSPELVARILPEDSVYCTVQYSAVFMNVYVYIDTVLFWDLSNKCKCHLYLSISEKEHTWLYTGTTVHSLHPSDSSVSTQQVDQTTLHITMEISE